MLTGEAPVKIDEKELDFPDTLLISDIENPK